MNVFIIAAQSSDGYIAKDPHAPSTDWTSNADKQFFIQKTKEAGIVIMGAKTYQTIGKPLKNRLNIIYTTHPENIKNSIPLSPKPYPLNPNYLYTTNLPPKDLVALLENLKFKNLAVCGGASIYTMFLNAGVVNKLYLTIEPVIFGSGIKLIDKPINKTLKLVNTLNLSPQTINLEYSLS